MFRINKSKFKDLVFDEGLNILFENKEADENKKIKDQLDELNEIEEEIPEDETDDEIDFNSEELDDDEDFSMEDSDEDIEDDDLEFELDDDEDDDFDDENKEFGSELGDAINDVDSDGEIEGTANELDSFFGNNKKSNNSNEISNDDLYIDDEDDDMDFDSDDEAIPELGDDMDEDMEDDEGDFAGAGMNMGDENELGDDGMSNLEADGMGMDADMTDDDMGSMDDDGEQDPTVTPEEAEENKEKLKLFNNYKTLLNLTVRFKRKIMAILSYDNNDEFNNVLIVIKRKLLTLSDNLNQLFEDFDYLENDAIEMIMKDSQKELQLLIELLNSAYNKYINSDDGEKNTDSKKLVIRNQNLI